MRLVLLVRREVGAMTHGHLRAVERPYHRVPAVGELVMLDDAGEVGHAVDQISWDNDGAPVLRFSGPPVSARWLERVGFEQVVVA